MTNPITVYISQEGGEVNDVADLVAGKVVQLDWIGTFEGQDVPILVRLSEVDPDERGPLLEGADAAYDREDQAWFDALSTEDLTVLWAICCDISQGAAWDDEVYDALAKRGHFKDQEG